MRRWESLVAAFVVSLAAGIVLKVLDLLDLSHGVMLVVILPLTLTSIHIWSKLRRYKRFDITAIHDPHTAMDLRQQLETCEKSLSFLGVSARTVVGAQGGQAIRAAFARTPNLKLCFLLFDPRLTAHGKRRAKDETGDEKTWDSWKGIIVSSIEGIEVLKRSLPQADIQVRIYKEFPVFRMFVVDESRILANFYGRNFLPSEISSLFLTQGNNRLFNAYQRFFEELWGRSEVVVDANTMKAADLRSNVP